jgi:polyribonucleotide nucleotidyltransferase
VEAPETFPEIDKKVEADFAGAIKQAFSVGKKLDRQNALAKIHEDAVAKYETEFPEKGVYIKGVLDDIEKKSMRAMILDEN